MGLFEFNAVNKDSGRRTADYIWAKDNEDARNKLASQNYIDVRLSEISPGRASRRLKLKKVKKRDMVFFLHQFSDLLKRGVMPDKALDIIKNSSSNRTIELAVSQMIIELQEHGETFAAAFRSASEVFFFGAMPENCIRIIEAGNQAGPQGLAKALTAAISLLDRSDRITRKILTAMTYPAFLVITSVMIVIYLFSFTIPKIIDIFSDLSGRELPLITRGILFFSGFMEKYWVGLILAMVALVLLYRAAARSMRFGLKIDTLKLSVPYFGVLIRKSAISNFSGTLSILLEGGLDIMKALEGTIKVHENRAFNVSVEDVINRVSHGESLADALGTHQNLFYPDVIGLVNVGEKIAELPSMLEHVSRIYEEDIDYRISYLTALVEPVIILVMGIIVGLTVLGIMTPLFEMSGL